MSKSTEIETLKEREVKITVGKNPVYLGSSSYSCLYVFLFLRLEKVWREYYSWSNGSSLRIYGCWRQYRFTTLSRTAVNILHTTSEDTSLQGAKYCTIYRTPYNNFMVQYLRETGEEEWIECTKTKKKTK